MRNIIYKIKRRFKSKSGSAVLNLVIVFSLLFPITTGGLVDAVNFYNLSKTMKVALDLATKSATTRMDFSQVPTTAKAYIDTTLATSACKTIYAANMNFDPTTLNPIGNTFIKTTPKLQTFIYNNYSASPVSFPATGTIDSTIINKNVQVSVTKPTVFAIARVDYISFFGETYSFIRFAASQLYSS